MSTFLALTPKSSRKAASLRKGDRDPRTYVWTDRTNFKRYVCFKTRNGTGMRLAVFWGKVCPLGSLRTADAFPVVAYPLGCLKKFAFLPHSSVRAKN